MLESRVLLANPVPVRPSQVGDDELVDGLVFVKQVPCRAAQRDDSSSGDGELVPFDKVNFTFASRGNDGPACWSRGCEALELSGGVTAQSYGADHDHIVLVRIDAERTETMGEVSPFIALVPPQSGDYVFLRV